MKVAARLHRHGDDRHDLVAVDDPTRSVNSQAPVGVAVVRDAHVGSDAHHVLRQKIQVRRTHAVVDVQPVGVGADHGHPGSRIAEGLGRHSGGGAVRAVEHDMDAVEPVRQRTQQVHDVAVFGVGEAADAPHAGAGRLQLRSGLDQRFEY
ncbi:MAG TPA: hypothetical protein VL916_07520 [Ilumatobacteraceae bacterium]|nr:hypothetical protein [Ilumatobacteraceae bacterium]